MRQGNGNGVIPAHRSKGVEFAFCPSLAGTFAESLSVTNVLDESNTQVITIKAKVSREKKQAKRKQEWWLFRIVCVCVCVRFFF